MSTLDEKDAAGSTGWIRLAIGFAQGVAAWLLIDAVARPGAAHAGLLAALALVAAFPPMIVLAGLGRMRLPVLLGWTALAAAVLAGLGVYDLWREPLERGATPREWPSPQLIFFGGAALYIAHHLIEPADLERRWNASYEGRFESAWRHGFQLALSLAFTGVFWGVLMLGAALFKMIGIDALFQLMREPWFIAPLTGLAFAGAVHLTDVRPGLIRGVRTVALTLLSWLLPLMTGLAAVFLVALVFTGVQPLWDTRRGASLLLAAAAVLIVLVNTAYQDGRERESLSPILRWAGRAAAVLPAPLTVLAAWATALRIGQYGLTPERIVSVAVLAVAAVYAVGYAWAAISRGPWMRPIETVNVVAAGATLVAILALLSPVADPARLSVADQVRRLEAKATAPETFDYRFLRFDAGRFGRKALARLAKSGDPRVADRARKTEVLTSRYGGPVDPRVQFSGATILPEGASLPESFRRQAFERKDVGVVQCMIGGDACDLTVLDLTGDGTPEVLAADRFQFEAYVLGQDGRWRLLGALSLRSCGDDRELKRDAVLAALKKGEFRRLPPLLPDLEIAGHRLDFERRNVCLQEPGVAPAPARAPPAGLGPAFIKPSRP